MPDPSTDTLDSVTRTELTKRGIKVYSLIAKGSYGQVYKGSMPDPHDSNSRVDVAIKVYDPQTYSEKYRLSHLPAELFALQNFHHPFAIKFYNQFKCVENNRIIVIMEFAPNGTLQGFMLARNGPLPEAAARKWFQQIASAVEALHRELGMAHRDIKMENLLIDSQHNLRIADYGFAKEAINPKTGGVVWSETYCGTLPYLAPEMVAQRKYAPFKSDVWALGVVLYVMNTRRLPFHRLDSTTHLLEDQLAMRYKDKAEYQSLSAGLRDLLDRMLNPQEGERIEMKEVLQHEWLSQ